MEKHVHEKIDILTKFIGLLLVAIGIDHVITANWPLAGVFLLGGASLSIVPFFIKIE